jgi:hypothetical protein
MPRPKKSVQSNAIKRYYASKRRVVGHGDYKSLVNAVKNAVKSAATTVNSAMGEPTGPMGRTGSAIGRALGFPNLGKLAGNLIGKLTGTGQYINNADKIRHNSLFNRTSDGVQIPSFGETDRSTRVMHREYIGDLVSGPSGTPSIFNTWQNINVNPALLDSFAWLSQIAQNYDSYKFHGLVFEFKSMSGSATGANTQLGNVIFSAQYNAANPPFTNKLEMENYQGACSCNPSENMLFGIECDPKDLPMNHLYTRSGQVPAGQTQQIYDMCSLQIATQGVPTINQILGEIWVTYDVELYQPKLFAGQVGNNILSYSAFSVNSALSLGTANKAFLGMTPNKGNTLSVDLSYDGVGNGLITLDDSLVTGQYVLTYSIYGANTACSPPSITYSNAVPLNIFGSPFVPLNQVDSGVTTTGRFQVINAFEIDNDNAQPVVINIKAAGTITPGAVTVANLFLTQIGGLIQPL